MSFVTRFSSSITNIFLLSGISSFPVVLAAGFCIYLAGIILSLGSEALFHHQLPAIGWFIPIYYGGKMLASSSKLRYGKALICGFGYVGMFALILCYVFRS